MTKHHRQFLICFICCITLLVAFPLKNNAAFVVHLPQASSANELQHQTPLASQHAASQNENQTLTFISLKRKLILKTLSQKQYSKAKNSENISPLSIATIVLTSLAVLGLFGLLLPTIASIGVLTILAIPALVLSIIGFSKHSKSANDKKISLITLIINSLITVGLLLAVGLLLLILYIFMF